MAKKIIFLDLEGTLIEVPRILSTTIPKSMWQTLARMLGEDCLREEEASHVRWLNGQIHNYLEWMDETIKMFIRYGLRKEVVDELVNGIKITHGVQQFAQRMLDQGAVLAIVTGALKSVAEPIQIALRAQHLFAGCELYFDKTGAVEHWNLLPSDWSGKAEFMNLLIKEYGANAAECAFIGDGNNDVELAKSVGFSIAFNADDALVDVANISIVQLPQNQSFEGLDMAMEDFWKTGS